LVLTPQEIQWLRERAYLQEHRHGLAVRAASQYPADARLAGTPLLTAPGWRPAAPVPLEEIRLTLRPERFGGTCPGAALPERADGSPYASYSQAVRELDPPAVFQNRPVYRLSHADLAGGRPSLDFGLGRYFDSIDTGTAAAHEYAAAEAATGGQPGAAAAGAPSAGALPVRAAIGDPCDLRARPVILAVATLTLRLDRATGTARFPLHWRDPGKVGHAGGMYMVVPTGIFQPSGEAAWNAGNDFDLWKCMVREYAEELLGADEDHDSERAPIDYEAWPFARRMAAARDRGQVRAWCVGLGVDPLTFATDLLTVTVFDAAVYDEMFGELVGENAEGTVLAARDLDEPAIAELTEKSPMQSSPGGTTPRTPRGMPDGNASVSGMQAAGAALLALAFRHRDLLCRLAGIPAFRRGRIDGREGCSRRGEARRGEAGPLRVLRRQRGRPDEGGARLPAGAQARRGGQPHPGADGDQPAGAADSRRGHGAGRGDPPRPRPGDVHRAAVGAGQRERAVRSARA
jgi:hypothetical protein